MIFKMLDLNGKFVLWSLWTDGFYVPLLNQCYLNASRGTQFSWQALKKCNH